MLNTFPMPRAELAAKRKQHFKHVERKSAVGLIVFFGGIGLNVWLCAAVDMNHVRWWLQVLYGVLVLIQLVGALVGVLWIMLSPKHLMKLGLFCPNCGMSLVEPFLGRPTTGDYCTECGTLLVSD